MAYELKQAAEQSQRIELTGREKLTVTGVEDVERFDELSVVCLLYTSDAADD